uniref:(California timema) hypothetical protein n=1 Tax=Timema californicum TaxID=61474 RepID=A0A7R9J6Z5_TIMCA|nr:unnamed protein product [Timema californicum]
MYVYSIAIAIDHDDDEDDDLRDLAHARVMSHQSPRNNYPHHSHHGGMPLDPPGTYGGLNPHHKGGRGQMVKRRRNNPPRKEYSNMR